MMILVGVGSVHDDNASSHVFKCLSEHMRVSQTCTVYRFKRLF